MSETNIFLVPVDEPSPGKRKVKAKVLRYLTDTGIVEGFYDEELGWYAAGPRSWDLFGVAGDGGPAFEYAIIYDRAQAHFVPDSHTGGFGARCTSCGGDLDDVLYELLEDQGEGAESKDVAGTKVECGACSALQPLTGLKAEIDTGVTRFYLNFCHVDSIDIDPNVSQRLAEIIGAPIKIVPERL